MPRGVHGHIGHDADRGVIVWGGSHTIRRGSGVYDMGETPLRPSVARSPRVRRSGPGCAPSGRAKGAQSAPRARQRRAESAPKSRPLRGGYRRRCAGSRTGLDIPADRPIRSLACSLKIDCSSPPYSPEIPV